MCRCTGAVCRRPGAGWDSFQSGAGEALIYTRPSAAAQTGTHAAGKGWDSFHAGAGEAFPVTAKYLPTGLTSADVHALGNDWDSFQSGAGEAMP